LLNKKEYDHFTETIPEGEKNQNIAMNLKKEQEFKEFEKKVADSSKHYEYIRDQHLPKFIPFVNLADLEHPNDEKQ